MFRKNLALALLFCLPGLDLSADVIDGEELVDPTRPIFSRNMLETDGLVLDLIRNVVPSSYEVTFVRAGDKLSIAIVNGQRVTVGDAIGGATVVSIDRGGVTLLIDEQETRVSLYGASIKAPVTVR